MADEERTASGLDPNVAAALAYGLGWITGVLFLLMEPANRFVRFHARQSTIVFGAASAIAIVLPQLIPYVGMLVVVFLVMPVSAVLWLLLMFKAYMGERFKVPVAGDLADGRA